MANKQQRRHGKHTVAYTYQTYSSVGMANKQQRRHGKYTAAYTYQNTAA